MKSNQKLRKRRSRRKAVAQSYGSKVDIHYDRQAAEGEWYVKSLLTKAVWGEGFCDEKKPFLKRHLTV